MRPFGCSSPRMIQCRLANVGVGRCLGSSRMSGSPGAPRCTRGRSVETPRYVELSHVLRVLYLHVLQIFHVVQSSKIIGRRQDATAGLAAVATVAARAS